MPGPNVPFPPMEANLVRELPRGDEWQYEPKWDGFRGVLENDGGELALWSRKERPLLRYFPELRPLGDLLPPHSALDGEIVIARDGVLEFDSMQMRLHPAESRIRKLAAEIPAQFIAFDVLLWDGEELWRRPLAERRTRLEQIVASTAGGTSQFPQTPSTGPLHGQAAAAAGFRLSPYTLEADAAEAWLDDLEAAGLDGVIAKRRDTEYRPGARDAVLKVKAYRTADCVVVGLRWKAERGGRIATLLLGLYGDEGELHYVGSAAVAATRHDEIAARVLPLLDEQSERRFSEPNRWGTGDLEESALRPELVAEVRYDKVQGLRLRHGTKLLRFREDKEPRDCTWRELRPPRDANALTVERLLA